MPKKKIQNEIAVLEDTKERFLIATPIPELPKQLLSDVDKCRMKEAQTVAKAAIRDLDAKKAEIIDPISTGLKRLKKEWDAAVAPWKALLEGCRQLVLAAEWEATKEAQKAAEKLARKAEKKGEPGFAAELRAAPAHQTHVAQEGVHFRVMWRAKIVSEADVPIAYEGLGGRIILRPVDEALLNRLAKDHALTIPGVEWVEEKIPVLR